MESLPRILVVDDESRAVEFVARALRRLAAPTGAESGEAAWELVQREDFALVISDQRMPGMSGVELLSRVAESREATGRILMTGYADFEATVDAVNRGRVHAYLHKPCDLELLRSTVRGVLERLALAKRSLELETQGRELRGALLSAGALTTRLQSSAERIRLARGEQVQSLEAAPSAAVWAAVGEIEAICDELSALPLFEK